MIALSMAAQATGEDRHRHPGAATLVTRSVQALEGGRYDARVRVVVFGSTGRTGTAVLERALARGHEVAAFARSPEKVGRGAEIVVGDAFDPEAVAAAIRGRDAVITALGVPIVGPTTDLSRPTAHVIHGAEAAAVRRLSAVLSAVVFLSKVSERFVENRNEHLRNLETLRESALEWVGLCPNGIEDGPWTGPYVTVIDGKAPGGGISRFDLADALIDALERDDWVGHPVGISNEETSG
jgi:putative NADH-flavin reductase